MRRTIRWSDVECREFMRYPGGGSAIPEEEPSTITWVMGMADAVVVRNEASGEAIDYVPLPTLTFERKVATARSCLRGSRAATGTGNVDGGASHQDEDSMTTGNGLVNSDIPSWYVCCDLSPQTPHWTG